MAKGDQMTREDAATLHLQLWLTALCRTLRAAVDQRTGEISALRGARGPAGTLTPKHAARLIGDLETRLRHGVQPLPELALTRHERKVEAKLRAEAATDLPLDQLRRMSALGDFDCAALLIAVAGEIMPEFPRLAGYVVDDLARGEASVELVLALTRGKACLDGWRLRRLGPGGPLRRLGLLGTDEDDTRLATRLLPAPGLAEWLLGARRAPPVALSDPRMIWPDDGVGADALMDELAPIAGVLARMANGAGAAWGGDTRRHDDVAAKLAAATGRAVFRAALDTGGAERDWADHLRHEAAIAAGAGAILWLEIDRLPVEKRAGTARVLTGLAQRLLLTGRMPWRSADLIRTRPFVDVTLSSAPPHLAWPGPAKDLPMTQALDARHHLGLRQRQASLQLAMSEQRMLANGQVPDLAPLLEQAAKVVAAPADMGSVRVVTPKRRLDELVLPEALHRQIEEIATFYGKASLVDAAWGFGRMTGSDGALKVLFTGDPGTGKTMAAECIAETAGVGLLKVDLSQIVSKWVGETEKNLEEVFAHAEQSRAALFFDEAEALFGKRGDVQRGTDRYANMEVSFLLQRLESFSGGLVILASNLKGDIDPAFSRRFQVSLDFPRPGPDERLRLWRMAFQSAPVAPDLDLERLARFDLTGGAIVTSARMAALLAAGEGASEIGAAHLEAATERQFRKEARLMDAGQSDGLAIARARI